jgi:hypothetical protein
MNKETTLLSGLVTVALTITSSASAGPPEFPMWCRGAPGMASPHGTVLIVEFTPAGGPAPDGLQRMFPQNNCRTSLQDID